MLIKKYIFSIRQRKKEKKDAAVYNDMLFAVSMMCVNLSSSYDFTSHIRKATAEEIEQLINEAKSIPPSVPGGGYYIPSLHNYVVHCLETWPDRVFFFKHLDFHDVQIEEDQNDSHSSLWASPLPLEYMNKDLYVFYYNNFGLPGTHLCAREGYVFYDAEDNQIVACAWQCIS